MRAAESGDRAVILIIEDDPVVADMYALVLREKGWVVEVSHDGRTGSARAREICPSLVLLDLGLPDRHGLEVLDEIKTQPSAARTPIVVFTNYDDAGLIKSALSRGAAAYLLKANTSPGVLAKKIALLLG